MVRPTLFRIGLLLLVGFSLGACSGSKTIGQKGRDADYPTLLQGAGQATREMEGKQGQAASSQLTGRENIKLRVLQPGKLVCVEIDTCLVFSDATSIKEARAQTLKFVRQLALEKALPAEISLTSLTALLETERNARYDQSTATGIFMLSSSAGRFEKEEVLAAQPLFAQNNNTLTYRMHYRAEIIPMEKSYNSSLKLDVKLSESLLQDGDTFRLSVCPNAAGYLYLFDFYADGSAALVFPKADFTDNKLQSGQKWEQTLGAKCDPERDVSIETLYFVFSTEPISGWEEFRSNSSSTDLVFNAGEESFMLFQKWLSRSDPAKRIEKMAQIHIYKN